MGDSTSLMEKQNGQEHGKLNGIWIVKSDHIMQGPKHLPTFLLGLVEMPNTIILRGI